MHSVSSERKKKEHPCPSFLSPPSFFLLLPSFFPSFLPFSYQRTQHHPCFTVEWMGGNTMVQPAFFLPLRMVSTLPSSLSYPAPVVAFFLPKNPNMPFFLRFSPSFPSSASPRESDPSLKTKQQTNCFQQGAQRTEEKSKERHERNRTLSLSLSSFFKRVLKKPFAEKVLPCASLSSDMDKR